MESIANIDRLILNEKRAISWHLAWFLSVILMGGLLIVVNVSFGWIKEVGPNIGTAFILLLAKPPLSEVLKRRDRLTALDTLKVSLSQMGSDEAGGVETLLRGMLQKMLEG